MPRDPGGASLSASPIDPPRPGAARWLELTSHKLRSRLEGDDGGAPVIERGKMAPTRILIVDDEATYRDYLERFLARDGHEVRTAETGAQAIALAREFAPEVLLADWMLRCEMHGIEVGETLRASLPKLRILLMTGFPTADLEAEATRVGIDGLLEKPFALEELSQAIRAALAEDGR